MNLSHAPTHLAISRSVDLRPHIRIAMIYQLAVAALAFQAPSPMTRRDMLMGGGAAAAAFATAMPAFANPADYAGQADIRAKAKAEAKFQKDMGFAKGTALTPYQEVMAASQKNMAKEKAEIAEAYKLGGGFSGGTSNGKGDNGVSYRKPTDPNGCSDSCKKARLEKFGF